MGNVRRALAAVAAAAALAAAAGTAYASGAGGDWTQGERGQAALPGRQAEFRAGLQRALEYATTLSCPRLHLMAGLTPAGVPRDTLL